MAKLNVLCGFVDEKIDQADFEQIVGKVLLEYGKEAKFEVRTDKGRIREYVETNKDCEVVILQERIGNKKWTAEEVAQLTETRDVNVIIVLSERYKGKEYMKTLLVANVTNAIFQKGRNGGASARDLAELIVKRRSRKEAREYYGIGGQRIELGYLDEDTYMEYYNELHGGKGKLIENYIGCCGKMSPQQIADFTKRLPENDFDELVQYQEFHVVMQLLKKFGYDLKVKKPRKVVIGLKTPMEITFKGFEKKDEDFMKTEAVEESADLTNDVNISDEALGGMSAADILACISGDYVPSENMAKDEESCKDAEPGREEESAVLSDSEKNGVAQEDVERAKEEAREEVRKEYEKRLREAAASRESALEIQERALMERQFDVLLEQEKDHTRESIAYEKEIKRLKKDTAKLKSKLDKYAGGEDDYILDAGGKQFSWGILIVLALLVVVAVAVVYFKPELASLVSL